MKRKRLSDWAAISEIVATVAVVFSLLLVAYSIKRNTDEMEVSNSNFLYELDEQITGDIARDPNIASIFLKVSKKEPLTEVERFQYEYMMHRYLGVWEIAWTQHQSGSLSAIDWRDWDQYLAETVTEFLSEGQWGEIKSYYKPEFIDHVDAKYAP